MKKKKKKLYRRIPELSFLYTLVRGAIGKEYVIKHYSYGAIRTKFPDMTKIIASAKQRKCRNKFQEAVAYAKSVIADKEKKKEWQKKLRRRNGVYNAAIKEFMLREKRKKEIELAKTNTLIHNALKGWNGMMERKREIPKPVRNPVVLKDFVPFQIKEGYWEPRPN